MTQKHCAGLKLHGIILKSLTARKLACETSLTGIITLSFLMKYS